VGNAHSALAEHMARGISQANGDMAGEPLIDAEIVGRSVAYMANLPLDANASPSRCEKAFGIKKAPIACPRGRLLRSCNGLVHQSSTHHP
jgi:hypothetical protein